MFECVLDSADHTLASIYLTKLGRLRKMVCLIGKVLLMVGCYKLAGVEAIHSVDGVQKGGTLHRC